MYLFQLSRPRRASRVPSRLGDENGPAATAPASRLAAKSSTTSLAGAVQTRAAAKQSTSTVTVGVAGPGKGGLANAANPARRTLADVSNATARVRSCFVCVGHAPPSLRRAADGETGR